MGRTDVEGFCHQIGPDLFMSPTSRGHRSGGMGTAGRGFRGEKKKKYTVLANGSICGSVFKQTGSYSKNFNLFISKRTVFSV